MNYVRKNTKDFRSGIIHTIKSIVVILFQKSCKIINLYEVCFISIGHCMSPDVTEHVIENSHGIKDMWEYHLLSFSKRLS